MDEKTFKEKCSDILMDNWRRICQEASEGKLSDYISNKDLISGIRKIINSVTKTYRYVLPTQLLAKLAEPELDSRCLQTARGGKGAFDARTIAHKVVVPFDRENENVLGGSPEPYVNNPLRIHEISLKYRDAQKNKSDWDLICGIIEVIENKNKKSFTKNVFRQVLKEIYQRLAKTHITYPVPNRISLDMAIKVTGEFLAKKSGGDRFEAITAALFSTLGRKFRLFEKIRRSKSTASDVSSNMVADIECIDGAGNILLAVEAKDRDITITQIQDKIPGFRKHKISEAFFIASQDIAPENEAGIRELIASQFNIGQNIYFTKLENLLQITLALIGEEGRISYITAIGQQLDEYSDLIHRKTWSEILKKL